jgi:signal transduction histidine kinase
VFAIELMCAMGFAAVSLWHERGVQLKALDLSIQGRSDSLIGAIQDAEDPQDSVKIDPEEFTPAAGDEFAVYNPNGTLVGASAGDRSALKIENREGFRDVRAKDRQFRVLERNALRIIDREETDGAGIRRPVKLLYAVPTDRVWHEVMAATRFYLFLSLASVVATALLLVWLARRLLHPLQELTRAAGSIEPSNLEFNPPHSALHTTELVSLAEILSQVVTRLRAAAEAERRFMSDAAHELKTAVAVVRSSIQVMTMKNRSAEEYRTGLDRVLNDNRRVEDLTSRMLALGRVAERNSQPTDDVDAGEEIRSALESIASYAEWKGVRIEAALDPDLQIRLVSGELKTVVSNLVMNALQHSAHGERIRVSAQRATPGRALVKVQDFGTGISATSLPHVFERFYREDPSRSRQTGGAGLGLSICKAIVDNAGGEVTIQSETGKGTTVTVSFVMANG